jgi:integrase
LCYLQKDATFVFFKLILNEKEKNTYLPVLKKVKPRWFIQYHLFDWTTGKWGKRLRDYSGLSMNLPEEERKLNAKKKIKELAVIVENSLRKPKGKDNINLLRDVMFKQLPKMEIRASTLAARRSAINQFLDFLTEVSPDIELNKMDVVLMKRFRNWLEIQSNSKNRVIGALKAVFDGLIEDKIITENPLGVLKGLKEQTGFINRALNLEQIAEFKAVVVSKDPVLWNFVQVIYYCFIRPKELVELKKKHIDINMGLIWIPSYISKNKKTQSVRILKPLVPILQELIKNKGAEDILFNRTVENFRYSNSQILQKCNLTGFTLYSWKHTGVVFAYKAGVTIKSLQRQLRHSSLSITDIYLKSLGLEENTEIDKMPTI